MPAAPLYVRDYRDELRRIGADTFAKRYRWPVLIVAARTAELVDGTISREKTMVANPSTRLSEGLVLVDRVFKLAKAPFAPQGPIVLGRSNENDVAIPEYSISKRHCFFEVRQEAVSITDCASTNGTLVDGVRLTAGQKTELRGGETITLGRYAFVFQSAAGFLESVQGVNERPAV